MEAFYAAIIHVICFTFFLFSLNNIVSVHENVKSDGMVMTLITFSFVIKLKQWNISSQKTTCVTQCELHVFDSKNLWDTPLYTPTCININPITTGGRGRGPLFGTPSLNISACHEINISDRIGIVLHKSLNSIVSHNLKGRWELHWGSEGGGLGFFHLRAIKVSPDLFSTF